MNEQAEPTRLLESLDETDGTLAQALRGAERDMPSAEQLSAIWLRLPDVPGGGGDGGGGDGGGGVDPGLDVGGLGAAAETVGGAGAAAAGTSGLLKLGAAAAILAMGAAAVMGVQQSSDIDAPPVVQAAQVALSARPEVAPETQAEPTEPTEPTAPTASTVVVAPPSRIEDPSEIALLRDAQSALSSNPGQALVLVRRAEQIYPSGALGQEREMIHIQALSATGSREAALVRARAFVARHPRSPHGRRLEVLFPELAQP